MPRLLRPHIPLETRCQVVLRQLGEMWIEDVISKFRLAANLKGRRNGSLGHLLKTKLAELATLLGCEPKDLRLDHDPALGARAKVFDEETGEHIGYIPDANDPEHLRYRPHGTQFAGSHDVKTRIRGDHGQYPDLTLIKRQRARENPIKRPKSKIKGRGFTKGKRPMKGRSSWPKGRKIPRRKK